MSSLICLLFLLAITSSLFAAGERKLIWSDEFDRDGLPDPAKWSYETGFVRNNEQQFYTEGRPENCRIEKGMLILEGRKEAYPNPPVKASASADDPASRPVAAYTSASIHTHGKMELRYGRVEVRAKLPQGKGVWPAIWTLGANIDSVSWPRSGEIDIMEFVGHDPGRIHATLHHSKDGKHASSGEALEVKRPFDDFHIYAVDWTPQRMDFFFDDRLWRSFDVAQATEADGNPYHKPHYLILNLALGGDWGGAIDDSFLPQRFLIDYVRVYEPLQEN